MDFPKRLKNAAEWLKGNGFDGLIVEKPIDIFYLTGIELSLGRLIITPKASPALFVDGRYIQKCQQVPYVDAILYDDESISSWLKSVVNAPKALIAFDSEAMSYKEFTTWEKRLAESPQVKLIPFEGPVKKLRAVKDAEEIALLRKAAKLGSEGYDFVVSLLRRGVTEVELATALEIFWKQRGAKGLAFEPIIAFGENSAMPHHRSSDRSLKAGDIVLIDIGVNLDGYHSDMTRCVFFGPPDEKLQEQYLAVARAQEAALEACRQGVLISDVDKAARQLLPENLFVHGLGHGVGLEIHEAPVLSNRHPDRFEPLEVGMVVTIEPGAYLPAAGGIRIEDTIVITRDGYEDLTGRSKLLQVIEPC